ncbi:protein of unknown function [Taphrina deformans PYCC 5710]|uniref:Uncharacterized protein n=1 Tax=Taphrina deformans (strain PYCC 5710 / ATCC 11124 / CBS 356.35 / IMI 108563 / JCM 9778 / NBRC 8474) TaxID=1097556 RepID=R4XFZ3_TAPDE|nr:protein of unknown function [Taphrina deformans PYCC 5710]|eukprot:CCG84801.1 protein of unknown function [Taphrina deformans PYCC 5710]
MAKSPPSSDFALRDILERWAGSDDTLKVVMMAKAEEDRLKQEVMRLEIRRAEMEMLREAVRAGIQPHLIPQIFSSGGNATQPIYTPISPTQTQPGPSTTRIPFPPPQQIPAYGKPSQPSPRYLPKLETNNIASGLGQPQTAPPNPTTISDQRQNNAANSGEPLPRNTGAGGQDPESSSLFFHHWQPPQSSQGGLMNPAEPQSRVSAETPGSPTPRKKKLQQYHILNAAPSPTPSRKSPTRGHVRHRSEASGLSSRFSDHYMAPVSSSNSFSRMSHDRDSPNPLAQPQSQSQNPTSHEIDLARKRKRTEQETMASDASAASTIPEETTQNVRV